MDFRHKVAAITGAASGIGQALAVALARRGCHVAIADVDGARLSDTARRVADVADVQCTTHAVDVADRAAVERFAADAVAAHGKVNLVFNNAGVDVAASVEDHTYEDFEWLMGVNFWGVVYGTKAFLPHLRRAGEGHVVNTSSVFGLMAVPNQASYHAAKFAVKGFTDSLRMELVDSPINVSCVMPGGVKTAIVKNSRYRIRDNAAPTKEEMAERFDTLAGLTPDEAAEWILRGVRKNKARILVGNDARRIALMVRLFPVGYMKLITWARRREERQRMAVQTAGASDD